MATKSKTADAAHTIETAAMNGAEALKNGFEKATKGYDQFVSFAKDTAEAWTSAANVTGKGIETINTELFAFSRQAIENSVAATKAMMASKSPKEFIEIQTDYARKAVEVYIAEVTKVGDLAVATAKDGIAPLQARVTALVELAQTARA